MTNARISAKHSEYHHRSNGARGWVQTSVDTSKFDQNVFRRFEITRDDVLKLIEKLEQL